MLQEIQHIIKESMVEAESEPDEDALREKVKGYAATEEAVQSFRVYSTNIQGTPHLSRTRLMGQESGEDSAVWVSPTGSLTIVPMTVLWVTLNSRGPQEFFEPGVWKSFSRGIKEDLSSAVLCLLIGEWTPAVMIALRAAEEAVRKYYEFKTSTTLNVEKFKSWNDLSRQIIWKIIAK